MALKPSDLILADDAVKSLADIEEVRIDKELRGKFSSRSTMVTVSYGHQSPREQVVDELIRRYQLAGWNVRRHDDQREGFWLSFSPRDARHRSGMTESELTEAYLNK